MSKIDNFAYPTPIPAKIGVFPWEQIRHVFTALRIASRGKYCGQIIGLLLIQST